MLIYLFLFLFGTILGSFMNVVSIRYDPQKFILDFRQIGGRSRCPYCRRELRWYELVPILSFIIQAGKCRNCRRRISWQYPVVEFLFGAVFVLVPLFLSEITPMILGGFAVADSFLFIVFEAVWVAVFSLLILLSVIDFRNYLIPDAINISLLILGIANILLMEKLGFFGDFSGSFLGSSGALLGLRSNIWVNHLWALFLGAAIFLAIIIFSRGRAMGWGDVKLVAVLGIVFGWPDLILVLFFAFVLGSIISLVLIAFGRKTRKDVIPFGPFLALGAFLTFFGGYWFMRAYFGLFSFV